MTQLHLLPERIEIVCRSCGSSFTLSPGFKAKEHARECLVCPVCWAPGPGLDDIELDEAKRIGEAECRPPQGYRLLGCVRPDGPELEGAPREMRELARMMWRLAER